MITRRIAISILATIFAVTVALLLAMPRTNGPSALEWMAAMIAGRGKPDYPVSGTVESRMDDFLRRHPQLQPAWRDVPDQENRFLRLREFIHTPANSALAPDAQLSGMLVGNSAWDAALASAYLDTHRATLEELRAILDLTEVSAASLGYKNSVYYESRLYKHAADALHVSLRQNLHAGAMDAAFRDFAALHQLGATLDRHEVPNLLSATLAILFRSVAFQSIERSLEKLPASTDWSPWIRFMKSEPADGPDLARIIRGEAWCSMAGLVLPMALSSSSPNPIWNFPTFEDGYAKRMIELADSWEHTTAFTPADLGALKTRWMTWEVGLGKGARETLKIMHIGQSEWLSGYLICVCHSAHTLAALQLLEIERKSGAILHTDDPRLAALAIDPASGQAFPFDPEQRLLNSVEDSPYLVDGIQLPPPAGE